MGKNEKEPFIVLDNVEYKIGEMTDQQKAVVHHLTDLDKKIGSMQFNIEQLQVGREAFIKMLKEFLAAEKVEMEVVQ